MKKFNCYIVDIKRRSAKGKYVYSVKDWSVYPDLNFEQAMYFAVELVGGLTGYIGNKNVKPSANCTQVIGFYHWYDDIKIAVIRRVNVHRENKSISDISIYYHDIKKYSCPIVLKKDTIDKLIEAEKNSLFIDYGIESANIWGPVNFIPKGYAHIKEGLVEKGDYYFDHESHNDKPKPDSWQSVDVCFSWYKPGKKIELSGVRYVGGRDGKSQDEVINYYKPFIIRKIKIEN